MKSMWMAAALAVLWGNAALAVVQEQATPAPAAAAAMIDVPAYLAEREALMVQVNAGELGRISRRNRNELSDAWATLQRLLTGLERFDQLDPAKRVELYAAQSRFTAIINHQREHGLICREVAPTGTRIPRLVCERVADRDARRLRDKEATDALQRPTCVPGQGGSGGSC